MKNLIIIPTYNESQNIEKLIEEILILHPQVKILVIDDNSSDGTGELVKTMAQRCANIQLMQRSEKLGLGSALKAGYRAALEGNFDCILQMDADFSHNPQEIGHLLNAAASGAGLVIGSRYKGGFRVKDWSLFRMGLSYLGNLYARFILGFRVYDATSGFRCFRSDLLKEINLSALISKGYGLQIEMTYLCYRQGSSIKEVPILFTRRKAGSSKLDFRIVMEAFFTVLRIKFLSQRNKSAGGT